MLFCPPAATEASLTRPWAVIGRFTMIAAYHSSRVRQWQHKTDQPRAEVEPGMILLTLSARFVRWACGDGKNITVN
jgi:hypothetical protein